MMESTVMEYENLALLAGATITLASIPQIWTNLTDPEAAKKQSISRNALMVAGNAAWTFYGVQNGLTAVPLFCSINCLLIGVLLCQQLSRKFSPPRG